MNEFVIKKACLTIANECVSNEGKGCVLAAWTDDAGKNGVSLGGDGVSLIICCANIVDKLSVRTNTPYPQIIKAMKKILRDVNRNRKPGAQYEFSSVDIRGFREGDDE